MSEPSKLPRSAVRGKLISAGQDSGDDGYLNACVGRNTGAHDNSVGYSGGFQSAAEIMLRILGVRAPPNATENWGNYPLVDMLVYPICYCARHHVELVLKASLPKAWAIFRIKSPHETHGLSEPKAIEKTHSVLQVWTQLHALCEKGDSRLADLTSAIRPYIVDIDSIDASGQTFRYAADAEDGTRHLDDFSHIDLVHFANGYAELCELLENLELTFDCVQSEVIVGTFTGKLNRDHLYEIAETLPNVDQWADPSFNDIKRGICEKYGLGSRDFQKACNKIKYTGALSWRIGIVKPIEELSKDAFSRLRASCDSAIAEGEELTLEQRSVVLGLIRIGGQLYLPEEFDAFLIKVPEDPDAAAHFLQEREQEYLARKVAGRPDLFQRGLRMLGQLQLLNDFEAIYKEDIDRLASLFEQSNERLKELADFVNKAAHPRGR